MLGIFLLISVVQCAGAASTNVVVQRTAWSFDASQLEWYAGARPDEEKKAGTLHAVNGWTEYRFDVGKTGWYALWAAVVPEWSRDWFLDGRQVFNLKVSQKGDVDGGMAKEGNLFLTSGSHTLRFRRLGFPGWLCAKWELRDVADDPLGCIAASVVGPNVIRAGMAVNIRVTAGGCHAAQYTLFARDEETNSLTPVAKVAFPASSMTVTRDVRIVVPHQGVFSLLPQADGVFGKPADLATGQIIAIDTHGAPPAAPAFSRSLVVDIDCAKQMPLSEKNGATKVIDAPFGAYRQSSGAGASENWWAMDGFSYAFDIPDVDGPYQLEVDYPDDDRRTMGFWINDQIAGNPPSIPLTGGVDTGDRYRTTNRMLTHVATFWPLGTHIVFAVVNLNHGMTAAAARIRVYKLAKDFGSGPAGRVDGRKLGFYYEESGRWLLHFGARPGLSDVRNSMLTMDRWGRFNRYLGANLMFPTVNIYQDNRFPSKVLEGYFSSTDDQCRMNALFAEKYSSAYIPELHLSGQAWFDKHVMGVWFDPATKALKFASRQAEDRVLRDKDGRAGVGDKCYYNALNSEVQDKYIAVMGELADDLADSPSFAGISSRLMLGWQWQGWNALPGLNWGYDDWTIAQFEKDTGVRVPGTANDPGRYKKRYLFLTGPKSDAWITWRCNKIYAYHQRILARIRRAKSSAKLFLTWYGQDEHEAQSANTLVQLRDAGIDPSRYGGDSAIDIIPIIAYGRRYSSPLADANLFEPLFNRDVKSLALSSRAGMSYGSYFEVGDPGWKTLGASNERFMNDVCTPSGRNELEDYAILLADSDCGLLAAGAFGQIYGAPDLMREFLASYTKLPALPFTPMQSGRDPVAVWYRQCSGGFYFYAVNREHYPVSVEITFAKASQVVSLASGATVPMAGNVLRVNLRPYELQSFRIAGTASIRSCSESIPTDDKALLASQVAFVDALSPGLVDRSIAPELTQSERDDCLSLISAAHDALNAGRYWEARMDLERAPLMNLYDIAGHYPPSLQYRKSARGFQKSVSTSAPHLVPDGIIGDVRGKLSSVTDLCFDRAGQLWVASREQVMLFDSHGQYRSCVHLAMPYSVNNGDPRWWNGASMPRYLSADALRALSDGTIAATSYFSPLIRYEAITGRVVQTNGGNGIALPGHPLAFDTDSRGAYYVACADTPAQAGVYKVQANGAAAFDFRRDGEVTNRLCDFASAGVAVDSAGHIYAGDRDGARIVVFDPAGKQLEEIKSSAGSIGKLAVTADGARLFAIVGDGTVAAWQRDVSAHYVLQWRRSLEGRACALAVSVTGTLAVGFSPAKDGIVARSYRYDSSGPVACTFTIASPGPTCLGAEPGQTTLQEYGGAIYYLTCGKLVQVEPGERDVVKVVLDSQLDAISFAFDLSGNLFIASRNDLRGKRGEYVWRSAKTADGWSDPQGITGRDPVNTDTIAMIPFGLAIDNNGIVLVRSSDNTDWTTLRIFGYDPNGSRRQIVDVTGLGSVAPWEGHYGLHVDRRTGRIFVASGPSHSVTCVNADASPCWCKGNSVAQRPGDVPLRGPRGVTTDREGRVWVADSDANRLLCFDSDGNYLASFGRFGGIDARDGFALAGPSGIATVAGSDGREWLYVADTLNQRLIKYRIENGR
ncbi:MAG: hypothetical protein P4L33_13155 [Capsulimonadaceae bacterium]|nr:hypothetical protein [Capsulimonadaceae bacterium]